jgi:hypothetical protein
MVRILILAVDPRLEASMTQTEIDHLCALPVAPRELFIDGKFEPAIPGGGIDLVSRGTARPFLRSPPVRPVMWIRWSPLPVRVSRRAYGQAPHPRNARRCCFTALR